MLEICAPGTFPDPQLMCAILDLPQAPLITRATFLLECAHFVHLCNRGQWPTWMKQNLPSFRPSGPIQNRASVSTSIRRIHLMQRAAGKAFYQWAECIGIRLEEMIKNDKANYDLVTATINDPEKQKQLILQDEEEDFLDDCKIFKFCFLNYFLIYKFYSERKYAWERLPSGFEIYCIVAVTRNNSIS